MIKCTLCKVWLLDIGLKSKKKSCCLSSVAPGQLLGMCAHCMPLYDALKPSIYMMSTKIISFFKRQSPMSADNYRAHRHHPTDHQ